MQELRSTNMMIDVYPVGLLEAWQHRRIPGKLRSWRRYLVRQMRAGNWRAVRNSFNGYLAEADGSWGATRCGHGWTKQRATDDLLRQNRTIIGETENDMKQRIVLWLTNAGLVIVLAMLAFFLVGATLQVTGVWPEGPRPIGVCR
jgi:hypothetical protein